MSHYTAMLDANVLYPAPMRDILLELAVTDIFRAKWTADIHEEWISALLRNEPQRHRSALERTRDLMNQATRDSLVTGYDTLIPSLALPDASDRHVLAAAIVGRCDVIAPRISAIFPPKRWRCMVLKFSTRTIFSVITCILRPVFSATQFARFVCVYGIRPTPSKDIWRR